MADPLLLERRGRLAPSTPERLDDTVTAPRTRLSGSVPSDDGGNSGDLAQLRRENASLRKQLQDERRLRQEAEDIIDQRQDEIYEIDTQLRQLLAEKQRIASGSQDKPAVPAPAAVPATAATPAAVASSSKESLAPTPPSPTKSNSSRRRSGGSISIGISRENAVAAYATLIENVKSFVEMQLSPVFESYQDLQPSQIAAPRHFLRLVRPRARMFLRLEGSDSVHFYAIIMEYLRQKVFDEQYAGLFAQSSTVSTLESKLKEIDGIATRISFLSLSSGTREAREWRARTLENWVADRELLQQLIDARVAALSTDLARLFLPMKAPHDAVDVQAQKYEELENVVRSEVIGPSVRLAIDMQLSTNLFEVKWVEHEKDSPSLSVCEALGLDYKRIHFMGNENKYSFLFDISPGLYMLDVSREAKAYPSIIFAQGVLLQKGDVQTQSTFIHWLHEKNTKPKPSLPWRSKKLHKS